MTRFMAIASIPVILICALYAETGNAQDTFTDPRDGKNYKTVKIGNQVWMAENLNFDAGDGSFCYGDDGANCSKYGRLYTWEAAKKSVPTGWHLPTKNEFGQLLSHLEGDKYQTLIEGGGSKFNILFAGLHSDVDIELNGSRNRFFEIGSKACLWTSTEAGKISTWYLTTWTITRIVNFGAADRANAFSVRCVKD